MGVGPAGSSELDSSEAFKCPPILPASTYEARKRDSSSTALLTDLPDALLRAVLLLLQSQRSALHAALACRALHDACLSDELWSAWSCGTICILPLSYMLLL